MLADAGACKGGMPRLGELGEILLAINIGGGGVLQRGHAPRPGWWCMRIWGEGNRVGRATSPTFFNSKQFLPSIYYQHPCATATYGVISHQLFSGFWGLWGLFLPVPLWQVRCVVWGHPDQLSLMGALEFPHVLPVLVRIIFQIYVQTHSYISDSHIQSQWL